MPGRGTPWRGVGQGKQDRIAGGEIEDGSISEVDLDSALQAKVNSGGGNWEKVGELLVTGGAISKVDINLTRTVVLDGTDVSQVVVVIHEVNSPATGNLYRFNNLISTSDWTTKGANLTSATYSTWSQTTTGIFADVAGSTDQFTVITCDGKQGSNENIRGTIETVDDNIGECGHGYWKCTTGVSQLTSFQMEDEGSGGSTIQDGTHVVVYAVTLN